jgi:secreted Zn-dependent insulinase-like peptidase
MPFHGEKPSLARFQPIKNHHRLDVSWPIEAANPAIHYRRKCAECVAHLLGHEGPGSAVSLLKKNGLITELSAGVRLPFLQLFELQALLTNKICLIIRSARALIRRTRDLVSFISLSC